MAHWAERLLKEVGSYSGEARVKSYADKNGREKPVRAAGKVAVDQEAAFRGYVNLNLSDEQKASYEQWSASASLWEVLEASVADGVQISLKLDPKGTGCLASATQRRSSSVNAGLVVTARGRDAATAFGRCIFILALLGHKERWEDTQPLVDPDRW